MLVVIHPAVVCREASDRATCRELEQWDSRLMKIVFNGQDREVSDGITIAQLLQQLDLKPRYVAVEVNLELVPRDGHQGFVLKAGDRLEVVTLVGGG